MPDIRIIKGIQIMPDQRTSLLLAGYKEPSKAWDDGCALFQELVAPLRRTMQPKAAVAFAPDGRQKLGLFVVLTLGSAVTKQAERYSADHEFSQDLLFNSMADSCLFMLEKQVLQQLPRICQERGVGIACRHEGGVDVPLAVQREAVETVAAKRTLGVTVSDDLVLVPEKTMCLVFDITADTSQWHVEHGCQQCQQQDCQLRQASSHLVKRTCPAGQTLLSYLQEQGVAVAAPCGGKGVCGKCKVQVVGGTLPVTAEDEHLLSPQELAQGYRLACQAVPAEAVQVQVPQQDESSFAVVGAEPDDAQGVLPEDHDVGIAIDIGSTTLAASLIDRTAQCVIQTATAVNTQRRFGADVVSRIQAANTGHGPALQQCIRQDLCQLVQTLATAYPAARRCTAVAIAGNTTMGHLLLGYSCQGLGAWPFRPVSLGGETLPAKEVFGAVVPAWLASVPVQLLPGISTYVGADITAGIWHCQMTRQDKLTLLLDLGTNGEMALGNASRLVVASTAVGPALEGGNISCGTGSVRGAICGVTIRHGRAYVETIDHAAPVGVCGSGIIEGMAGLVEQGLVDTSGKLREPYFTDGFLLGRTPAGKDLRLTQQDIREIQMAKSAVRAGLETLLAACQATYDDVGQVYLAGGFGYYVKPEKAASIGLLPQELVEKTRAVGNTSLAGATDVLTESGAWPQLQDIQTEAKEVVLANEPTFQELYIRYMGFQ